MSHSSFQTRTIIGLEIHVQLKTQTKMFCGCPVHYDAPPNSRVCPVCLGHPGALPVVNRRAFDLAVGTGLALHCEIARFTKWDRKSYFYPDLPKNYQISQYDLPLAQEGYFAIPVRGETRKIRIRRAHLEEDAGKNIHDTPGCTLVDLNRVGTPLLEIVTEPDLTSAEEVYVFCVELRRLVTYLGVSEGIMQRGQMRFEPNVNVAVTYRGREYRTPITEIKNLNSFRAVRDAIVYEAQRQVTAWTHDHRYILGTQPNENRGWNAEKGVTEFQRAKEGAQDYRYFPDPDLVPVSVPEAMLDEIRAFQPELPIARRRRLVQDYHLSEKDAETIVDDRDTADLFERVIEAGGQPTIVTKQFVNIWLKLANLRDKKVPGLGIGAESIAELAQMTAEGTINKSAANQLATAMVERAETTGGIPAEPSDRARSQTPPSPRRLAEELSLLQVHNQAVMEEWVEQVFAAHEQAVRDALTNPKKAKAAAGFLRGQVMRVSGGQADPKLVAAIIEKRLADRTST